TVFRAAALAALVVLVLCTALSACASRYHRASLDLDAPLPSAGERPLRLFLTGATGGRAPPRAARHVPARGAARRRPDARPRQPRPEGRPVALVHAGDRARGSRDHRLR